MSVLQPGVDIRPKINEESVKLLAEKLYGISVLELQTLCGYDDKNFKVTEDPNVKNPLITEHSPHGYVLKIMNSMDSQNLAVVEAQNEIMNYLTKRHVTCPSPIRNVFGQLYSVESISGQRHVVRLLRFVPGLTLKDVPKSDRLFYEFGEFVAHLDNKLEKFNHSGLVDREHVWMLAKVPELEKFKFVIKDAEKLDLVEEVIEEFKYAVVPRIEELEKGVIHGDCNDMNILVSPKPDNPEDHIISGILDFGDVHVGCYVFELATAMTYAILMTGNPKDAGYVLAGYSAVRRVTDEEHRLLKTLVSARLVQSLVLGAYTKEQDPNNTYVTSTEKQNGWDLLKKIRKTRYPPEEVDPTNWKAIANEYLTRS